MSIIDDAMNEVRRGLYSDVQIRAAMDEIVRRCVQIIVAQEGSASRKLIALDILRAAGLDESNLPRRR